MTDPAAVAQRQEARAPDLIIGLLTLPLRLIGVLCGSLLLSIVIEFAGMHWFWPEQGWHHAEDMLGYELNQISTNTRSLLIAEPSATAKRLVSGAYEKLFIQTHVLEWIRHIADRAHAEASNGLMRYLHLTYVHIEPYALAAVYTVLTVFVRALVLCLTLPLFILAASIGLIDGLVRRDIRRFGAGRESGFVYHRARATILPLGVLPWVVYLALPFSIHPLLILLPFAILLGIAVNVTSATFKKYL